MGRCFMLNLRRARLDDHWKNAFKRSYPASIMDARYSQGKIFDGMSIPLRSGINAFVGKNGIGKSNLIRSLYNAFATEDSNREKFQTPLLEPGIIEIYLKVNDETTTKVFHHGLNENQIEDRYENTVGFMFDPCTLIPSIQNLFVQQNNLEELLESYSEVITTGEDLKLINFLTNGDYQTVTLVNIEDEFKNFPRLPFFKVKTRDAEYDSRSMGLGELSLFYFYWLTSHMHKLEGNRILFIEEPESFLPPATQERLSDILAMIAAKEGVAIVLSSHSEHILRRLPKTHIHVLKKTPNGIRCLSPTENSEPLKILGLTSPKQGVLLFEDVAAEIFIKSLLKSSSSLSADNFYYHKSGSDGDILSDLKRFPAKIENFRFVAIFDGDCIGKYTAQLKDINNYCYLPEKIAPEEILIAYICNTPVNLIATALSASDTAIIDAKESAAGCDHHDYFHEFSKSLGRNFCETFGKICELWGAEAGNAAKVAKFIENIEAFFVNARN